MPKAPPVTSPSSLIAILPVVAVPPMPAPAPLLVICEPAATVRVPEPFTVAALPALVTITELVDVRLAVDPSCTATPPVLVRAPPRFSVPPPAMISWPVPDTSPSRVWVSAAPVVLAVRLLAPSTTSPAPFRSVTVRAPPAPEMSKVVPESSFTLELVEMSPAPVKARVPAWTSVVPV